MKKSISIVAILWYVHSIEITKAIPEATYKPYPELPEINRQTFGRSNIKEPNPFLLEEALDNNSLGTKASNKNEQITTVENPLLKNNRSNFLDQKPQELNSFFFNQNQTENFIPDETQNKAESSTPIKNIGAAPSRPAPRPFELTEKQAQLKAEQTKNDIAEFLKNKQASEELSAAQEGFDFTSIKEVNPLIQAPFEKQTLLEQPKKTTITNIWDNTQTTITYTNEVLTITKEGKKGWLSGQKYNDTTVHINLNEMKASLAGKTQAQAAKIIDQQVLTLAGSNNWFGGKLVAEKNILTDQNYIDTRTELIKDLDNPKNFLQATVRFFTNLFSNAKFKAKETTIKNTNKNNVANFSQAFANKILLSKENIQVQSIIPQQDNTANITLAYNNAIKTQFNTGSEAVIINNGTDGGMVAFKADTGYIIKSKDLSKPYAPYKYEIIDPINGSIKNINEKNIDLSLQPSTNEQIIQTEPITGRTKITTLNTSGNPVNITIRELNGSMTIYTADKNGNVIKNQPISEIKIKDDGSIDVTSYKIEKNFFSNSTVIKPTTITLQKNGTTIKK
ncbi:MAG: hypothetical protein ACXWL5_01550 [Candidatus Chromulinivorax sp.]